MKHLLFSSLAIVVLGILAACTNSSGPTAPNADVQPKNLVATATAPTEVSLKWDPVDGATGYVLERRGVAGGFGTIASPTDPAYSDRQVEIGTAYTYRVRVKDKSVYSAEVGVTTPTAGPEAATKGYFTPPQPWPVVATHSGLLPDGRVISFMSMDKAGLERDDNYLRQDLHNSSVVDLWDPISGSHTEVDNTHTDLFCSGHVLMPDGRFLVAGGSLGSRLIDPNSNPGTGARRYPGSKHTDIFDPATNTWSDGPDMRDGRWYPTLITLASGEILIVGGNNSSDDPNFGANDIAEVFDPKNPTSFRELTGAPIFRVNVRDKTNPAYGQDVFNHLYPWLHVAPNGLVFYSGSGRTMAYLDPSDTGSWGDPTTNRFVRDDVINPSIYTGRLYGSSVQYDIGKLLVVGGGGGKGLGNTAVTVDLTGGAATVARTQDMHYARTHLNATVLPDGKVFVNGGDTDGASYDATNAVYASETWDPATGQWMLGAAAKVPRIYHSTALLLPDGRVWTAGGGGCGLCQKELGDYSVSHYDVNRLSAELYYPPYLFNPDGSLAPRPTIVNAPQTIAYSSTFALETAQPNPTIAKVTLNKLGATTHAFNMGQHFLPLSFTRNGSNRLSVSAPASPNLAPPGYYLLFVIDTNGVPSVAKVVKVG
jgi:hypothetical protein